MILALILLFLPVVWLVVAALAVAACRAAKRADSQPRTVRGHAQLAHEEPLLGL
ncbi:MAG TPA: hypothetical protein VNV44_12515 [Solirubrobacteraceae bacterium]|nr:hypothetical protein [Solirubrobacteraceae bacterium]